MVNSIKRVELLVKSLINLPLQGGPFYLHPYFDIYRVKTLNLNQGVPKNRQTFKYLLLNFFFFLQFAKFNLNAPPYSKMLHFSIIFISRTPPQFSSIYNEDRGKSIKKNILTIEAPIIKGAIWNLMARRHSEEPWRASCPVLFLSKTHNKQPQI